MVNYMFESFGTNFAVNRNKLMKQIGVNLGKLRCAMGWTQSKMAELTGIAEPTLANYLKGERLPGIDYLVGLCAMDVIRERGIILKLDNIISATFDPERAFEVKETYALDTTRGADHGDFVGNYICYFNNQSKPVHEQELSASRELRLGVISIYDDYNSITAEKSLKARAAFFKLSELDRAVKMKRDTDAIFKPKGYVIDRNDALSEYYRGIRDSVGVYEGEVTFSAYHAFLNLSSEVYSDNALLILYSPKKRADSDYIGGLGCIASVAHGRMHMPTSQKIIVSRHELLCSFEEIAGHLAFSHVNITQNEESVSLTELCSRLYGIAREADFLDERDKRAIIENRLTQLVRNYIENSVCCVGCVSEEEDKKVYYLIKKYADR